ncbi:MAG TPA: thiamine phosphate synthase [Nitrospina sp.]|nr:thiamine phosphate synthase [Nitrospina sp.]
MPMDLNDLRLYLITDRSLFAGQKEFFNAVEQALTGGVKALQLREKDLSDSELIELGRYLRSLTSDYKARLFINSRADIAEKVGADGVHLTEACPSAKELRGNFPELLIGVSTHSLEKAQQAETDRADFITFSPIFDTPSKKAYGSPQGLDALEKVIASVRLPVLALGGIKLDNTDSVLDSGAFGVALITGIWNSSNIHETTQSFLEIFRRRNLL